MVSSFWSCIGSSPKHCAIVGLVLLALVSPGCQGGRGCGGGSGKNNEADQIVLGKAHVGAEVAEFYVAYGFDSAVLGFSVSTGAGAARYFPFYASTYRGIPSVVLDVFSSKTEDEMWVRSSWPGNEILAYRRVGSETATTQWGETKSVGTPMPDHLSGGPVPFPKLIIGSVVKKATLKHD
jgi:hypothetical protein